MSDQKLRWRNFPSFLMKPLIKVAAFGESKHGALSFLTDPITVNDHLDALKRHLEKLEDPNISDYDDESKELHSAHVAWRALAITHLIANKQELDDRYKGPKKEVQNFVMNSDGSTVKIDLSNATFLPEHDMDWQRRKDSYEDNLKLDVYTGPSFKADSVSAGDTGPGHWDLHKVQDGYVHTEEDFNTLHKLEMETRHLHCACKVCVKKD